MNLAKIKDGLKEFKSQDVSNYISYLSNASQETKSGGTLTFPWYKTAPDSILIHLFKKVQAEGLNIDGESVTLKKRGKKISEDYNYQAYKNKLIIAYPETIIDIQLVYTGDDYSFSKENGHILYKHNIGNPFDTERTIIGAYMIIKNSRGEFIETIHDGDIHKFRAVAKTDYIWAKWFDRMVLKSIMKRGCKTHFNDITGSIDKIDNDENYNMELSDLPTDWKVKIDEIDTIPELRNFHNVNIKEVDDEESFMMLIENRRVELVNLIES